MVPFADPILLGVIAQINDIGLNFVTNIITKSVRISLLNWSGCGINDVAYMFAKALVV